MSPPYEDDEAITNYILSHYQGLFTPDALLASRSMLAEAKAKSYGDPMAEQLRERYVSTDPVVHSLLADGPATFRIRLRNRLLTEHADKIHLNRCPKCSALARTPTACLCPVCNHTRYELRAKQTG